MSEFERQAGILGKAIQNNAKAAHAIVNASFHNATYSDLSLIHISITGLLAYLITCSGFFEFGRVSQTICTFLGMALVILIVVIWLESKNEPQGSTP